MWPARGSPEIAAITNNILNLTVYYSHMHTPLQLGQIFVPLVIAIAASTM